MEKNYSMVVKNRSHTCGNICVFQTPSVKPDNWSNIAWFSKAAHPDTEIKFEWTARYEFEWLYGDQVKHGSILNTQQTANMDSGENRSTDGACMEAMSVNEDLSFEFKPHPRYWVAFGDFKEGDVIDACALENAVELKPEDAGRTILIREDCSIHIE